MNIDFKDFTKSEQSRLVRWHNSFIGKLVGNDDTENSIMQWLNDVEIQGDFLLAVNREQTLFTIDNFDIHAYVDWFLGK